MVRRRKRKFILFIVELVILAVVIILLFYYQKFNQVTYQDVDGSKIAVNDLDEETLIEFSGYETIAVFGLDNRNLGEYAYGNTDVIMILNINSDTNDISMVSLYRDTLLNISAAGQSANYQKANAAYAYGGVSQAINMLNQNLDISIDNYVCVDFKAVQECIDILGGVDIEIESEYELKYLNDYIEATNDILGTNSPTVESVGMQTLDGTQAVAYSRIRYTAGGDYKRAQRQRIVLTQMMERAKDASLSQINDLLDAVFPDISTDLSQRELLSMAMSFLNYDISNSQGFPFDRSDTNLSEKGDVVVPCDLESNVIKLHEVLFGTENYQPSSQVQAISEYIVDLTGMTTASAYTDEFAYSDDYDYQTDYTVEDQLAEEWETEFEQDWYGDEEEEDNDEDD